MRRVRHNFSWQGRHFFVYTSWKLGSSLSCKLPIYNIIYICVWDRGQGDTVASKSMLAISYIKANGTQCSEENAGKYDINDDTRLYCKSRFSCARQMLPVWKHNGHALLTLCIRTASALLTRRSCLRCETGVMQHVLIAVVCLVFSHQLFGKAKPY